jgi:hypothetical protein
MLACIPGETTPRVTLIPTISNFNFFFIYSFLLQARSLCFRDFQT